MPLMKKSTGEINRSNIKVGELRRFLGLTMGEYADILGCNQSYVSLIESGKRDVTGQFVRLLMEKFHIKAEEIFKD